MMDGLPIATPEGYFVSREHERIAEIIQDYDPTLRLVFIPPKDRNPDDPNEKPFAVAHFPEDAAPYIAFFSDTCDERILERLFSNDLTKNDVGAMLDASEAAKEAIKLKKQMEDLEYRADIAKSMWRSPKHSYQHNGKKINL